MKKNLPSRFQHRHILISLTALPIFFGMLNSASCQTLLSYWNFNNVSPAFSGSNIGSFSTTAAAYGERYNQTNNSTPGTLSANSSNNTVFSGQSIFIDFSNLGTIPSATINGKAGDFYTSQSTTSVGIAGYGAFIDSTVNRATSDTTTGGSLLLLNTSGGVNNKYITFSLSSVGYESLSLSYATRLTSGVTSSQVWTYSLDGVNFLTLTTINPAADASFQTIGLNLSTLSNSALNNQSAFYLRMTYTSANAQGSQAFDNIQLTGVAVPESKTVLLVLGGLGLVFARRRLLAR